MIRNGWRIACSSLAVEAGQTKSVQIFDKKLVIFRDKKGRAASLLDRCPHKGTPLSQGTILKRPGHIKCCMHGWEFDRDGKCCNMPTEDPAVAETKMLEYSVPSFKTIECDGYIWVWMGDRPPEAESEPIAFPPGMERYQWIQDTFEIKAEPMRVLEHQLDLTRLMFFHSRSPFAKWAAPKPKSALSHKWDTMKHSALAWLPWRKNIAAPQMPEPFTYELRPTEHGFAVFTPPQPEVPELDGIARDSFKVEFLNPDRVWVQKLNKSRLRGGINDFHMISHFVPIIHLDPITGRPTGAVHTRAEFAYTVPLFPGFKLGRAPLSKPWIRSRFLKKDVAAVESAQAAINATAGTYSQPSNADITGLDAIQAAMRHVLQLVENDAWNKEARDQLPKSSIIKHWAAQIDYDNNK